MLSGLLYMANPKSRHSLDMMPEQWPGELSQPATIFAGGTSGLFHRNPQTANFKLTILKFYCNVSGCQSYLTVIWWQMRPSWYAIGNKVRRAS